MGDVFWGTFQYEIDGNISPMSAFEIKVQHKNAHKCGKINKCDPSLTCMSNFFSKKSIFCANFMKFFPNFNIFIQTYGWFPE